MSKIPTWIYTTYLVQHDFKHKHVSTKKVLCTNTVWLLLKTDSTITSHPQDLSV